MASAAGEGTSYGGTGGAGGKFRKRPFRKPQATPYDRPQTAIRNPSNKGWLSKFVDPASKLISASAHLFFNSVLRKRLPPPPSPPQPEASREADERSQQQVFDNGHGVQGSVADDGGRRTNSSDNSGLSELEQILKEKTFTRSEIESLTQLLHSRTIDLPNGDEEKGIKPNHQQLIPAFGRQDQIACSPVQEKDLERRLEESHRLQGSISTPLVKSQVLEDNVAAPAELAKAYMGSRPSKVSPSVLGLRSRALREDGSMLSNTAFPPSSPVMSLVRKPAVNFGISENGFMTPRSRGRSAIYNMARTPYSRSHTTSSQQGVGSVHDTYSGPSASFSSQFTPDCDGHYSSKHSTLKRRSSVLEDEMGSIGPIRRLRQKTNLAPPRNLTVPVTGTRFRYANGAGPDGTISSAQKLVSLDESKHKSSKAVGESEDNSMPSSSYSQVPSKSSEMASRILQQLEKMVPKEKSSEGKPLSLRDKSPSKLTSNMLRGQALKSIEAVDSSKLFYNAADKHKSLDLQKTSPDILKHDIVKEGVPSRSISSSDASISAGISRASIPVQKVAVSKTPDSHNPESVKSPRKKQGFRMTAVEDFEELDDENHSNVAASTPLVEGEGKLEAGLVENKAAASTGKPSTDKGSTPELRTSAGNVLNKPTDARTFDANVAGQEKFAFSFSAPSSGAVSQPDAAVSRSKLAFEKEPMASPSSSSHEEKVGSLVFSSSSAVSESTVPESSGPPSVGSKRFTSDTYSATGIISKPTFDKVENKDVQKASTLPTSSTSSIFSFGAPASNSNLSNGSSDSRLPTLSSAAPVQSSEKHIFTDSPSNVVFSTSATNSTSAASTSASNSSPTLAAASSSPSFPSFKFGSTAGAPSNSVPAVTATSNSGTTLLPVQIEKETSGNQTNLPSNGTSFALGSKGSSIFGFNATVNSSSAANNLPQSSLSGSGSGSLASTEVSLVGTGSAAVTQSAPFQFGSSASSPVFGTSGVELVASSSSVFGSSTSGSAASGSLGSGSFAFGPSGTSSSAFGSSVSGISAFGSSGSGSSIFGSSTTSSPIFGSSTTSTPMFGSSTTGSSTFGSASSPIFGSSTSGSSMFGSSTSGSSMFGSSTSGSSMFGSSTSGSSMFGSSTSGSSMFGSSTSGSSMFGSSTSGSSMFGSSTSGSSMFGASTSGGSMFGSSTTGSSPFGSSSSSGSIFGSSTTSTVTFGSSTPSTGFSFGASSATNNAPVVFGSSTAPSSGPVFSFSSASTSAPSSQPQPVFGSSFPAFTATAGNNNGDQMSMEEDPMNGSSPKVPVFGQSPIVAPSPGFMFGSPAPSTGTPSFQFGGQPSQQNIPQNPSPFQASGSLGGSFSLGSGGPEKSGRRIVKVKHNARRKK